MTRSEIRLEDLFLFAGVPEALEMAEDTQTVTYRRGESIYDEACRRRALGVLLTGRAEAVSAAQKRTVLASFAPGAVFGAAALFGMEGSYVSRIRAITDCSVRFLPEELLERMFLRYPRTAVNYIGFLSSRVRLLNGKIAVLSQNDAAGRLYRYLAENSDEAGRLTVPVTMTRLAGSLNMGRTSLYRAMETLEAKNLVVRKGDDWEVIK
ncbi:MAG: Crp/Fnr family transcriptional regulator [Oscillospiraceae bacterium]|nr:Crp/Fnr family transcriptional regulator [Oscillospiraceae bacterium]